MKPDELDAAAVRILCALQHCGQLSKSRLTELVGLSATPCRARLTWLKRAGLTRQQGQARWQR
ncbi:MAG: Lrp/AsnC family transcriptional regulator [Alphaproteobacteria bacterium]|nr:Lrp/AsnC family transcriptional regulator [Alphaproteobacteria bacterium]